VPLHLFNDVEDETHEVKLADKHETAKPIRRRGNWNTAAGARPSPGAATGSGQPAANKLKAWGRLSVAAAGDTKFLTTKYTKYTKGEIQPQKNAENAEKKRGRRVRAHGLQKKAEMGSAPSREIRTWKNTSDRVGPAQGAEREGASSPVIPLLKKP
jgi:hypothetical protein